MYKKSSFEIIRDEDLDRMSKIINDEFSKRDNIVEDLQSQITDLRLEINDLKDNIKEAKVENGSN